MVFGVVKIWAQTLILYLSHDLGFETQVLRLDDSTRASK